MEHGKSTYGKHTGAAFYLQTPNGRSARPALVISRDPALAPLGRTLGRQLDFSIATMRLGGAEVPSSLLLIRELLRSGSALLFAGFALDRIETTPISSHKLRLPAAPVSLEALRKGQALPR